MMVFLLIIALIAMILVYPFTRLLAWLVVRQSDSAFKLKIGRFIRGPFYFAIILIIVRANFELIHPSLTARSLFDAQTLIIFIGVWMVIGIIGLLREYVASKLHSRGKDHVLILLRPASTVLSLIVVFVGGLIWLDNIGFKVTTVLAGLGIGGLALALATQKSIEDFIGAMTLYLAAPVKAGDFCKFGDKMGTIEEIGLRSTKIRTLEDSLIIVPNAKFSAIQLENLTARKHCRFNPKIPLGVTTSADQIRLIIIAFKEILSAHKMVSEAPLRVTYIGVAKHSLDIEINCYIETVDINEYKSITGDLNLSFMDAITQAGSNIAIQSQINYSGESIIDTQAKRIEELLNQQEK